MVPQPHVPVETLYALLGIDEDASLAQIQTAWRQKALKFHPDHGGNPAIFLTMREAYETLKDDEKRCVYDRELAGTPRTANLAVRRCDEMLKELEKALGTAKDASNRMKGVLEEIQSFSRVMDSNDREYGHAVAGIEADCRRQAQDSDDSASTMSEAGSPLDDSMKRLRRDRLCGRNEEDLEIADETSTSGDEKSDGGRSGGFGTGRLKARIDRVSYVQIFIRASTKHSPKRPCL